MIADSVQLRRRLVEAIEQALGRQLELHVRRAFLEVSRHRFVPQYYVQKGQQWIAQDAGPEIYDNRFFFTRLDERGVPNSSSSQPSLMAPMLEALELSPGQRVLEIGTGTGYNAALIGAIVGSTGRVCSVDIASDLVKSAAERFREMPWVETAVANGLDGYASGAPYDRIIATGGSATVPSAWLSQLGAGGILVGSLLRGGTATPLYRLVRQVDGGASGRLLSIPAFFMGLSPKEAPAKSSNDLTVYAAIDVIERAQTQLDLPRLLKNPGLSLFVELRFPGLEAHLRYLGNGPPTQASAYGTSLLLPGRALLTFFPSTDETTRFQVEVRGRELLWSLLLEAYTDWEKLCRPELHRYRITIDRDGCADIALQ